MLIKREAHDAGIEFDPLFHLVPAHIAHHVIDVEQADGPRDGVALYGAEAGKEWAVYSPRSTKVWMVSP